MKKIFLVSLLLIIASLSLSAQSYRWAIGLKGGVCASGITFKYNFNQKNALDAAINYGYWKGENSVSLSANYEWVLPVITKGFTFFYGAGAFLGSSSTTKATDTETVKTTTFGIGVQGVAGLEYKIPNFPMAIDLNYQPALCILAKPAFYWANFALGVKFAF